jgi:hypothetical protein
VSGAFLLSKLGDEFGERAGSRMIAEILDLLFAGLVFDFLVDFSLDIPLLGQAVEGFFGRLSHPASRPWI